MRWKCVCAYDGGAFHGWQSQANGRSIQGQGIVPNIVVDAAAPPADVADGEMPRESSFDRHLRNEQGEKPVVIKRLSDYQLQVALDYLKSWAVFSKQSVKKG